MSNWFRPRSAIPPHGNISRPHQTPIRLNWSIFGKKVRHAVVKPRCRAFSVSKNWLADSKLHKCGVRRRIGKPLDRVSHDATAHRAVASPFLILMKAKDFASGGTRPKALPLESAAFWKRPSKTFCALFFAKRLF